MKQALSALPLLLVAGIASSAGQYHRDVPRSLSSEAKITEDAAVSAARRAVPNAKVDSVELEREGGQLLYSLDMKMPGNRGVEEVHVSAADGRVLSQTHESSKNERAEAAAEKKEKASNGQ